MNTWEERAAKSLDLTHRHDNRGPRTYLSRLHIAEALDIGKRPSTIDVEWLEYVIAVENEDGFSCKWPCPAKFL